jgi:radical SAM superfamily enzyme YgiQ (UPF0313 family)
MNVVLLSTYELGHQPFGLASPAAWLRAAGAEVVCFDLAVQPLDETAVAGAALIGVYVPMHTATRLAGELLPRLRALAPAAHICCFGLYATPNEALLRELGADTLIGGEFEAELVALYDAIEDGTRRHEDTTTRRAGEDTLLVRDFAPSRLRDAPLGSVVSLERLEFRVPERETLPPLGAYARLLMPDDTQRIAGYTEATRGCKHLCRHCPIVPVYGGRFRAVARDVVLEDIRRQVAAGAQHITFGDPDFFNGPGHALPLVRALHAEHPALTYDVTIKVEHLLAQARHLPELRDTGCLFITSAIEALDDTILVYFDKRHTRAHVACAVALLRETGIALNATFVAFTPWTTRAVYQDWLRTIADLGLVESVAPVQYAIRLLIPAGSRLLELPEVQALVRPFDRHLLSYPWAHPDPQMDELQTRVMRAVHRMQRAGTGRASIFAHVWQLAHDGAPLTLELDRSRALVPQMSEPWYC